MDQIDRKIALIGFRGVGKTTLATVFVEGRFESHYDPTIENTFRKDIQFPQVLVRMEIIDTAGMDEYSSLSRNASVGVHGYLLVYATTSRASFEKLKVINDMLIDILGGSADNIPRCLVGTITDLENEREVPRQEGLDLATHWNIPFLECSAANNENISEIFIALTREVEKDNPLFKPPKDDSCLVL